MGSAPSTGVIFVGKNLPNIKGSNNKNNLQDLIHIQNIYDQVSDKRQEIFLKVAMELKLVIPDQKTPFKYQDNFDEIFSLSDDQLKEIQKKYGLNQTEIYIILEERTKFIQSSKRHQDKQFTIQKLIKQQKEDLNEEKKTILFLGEKQTGITTFANCVINSLKTFDLKKAERFELDGSMYYNEENKLQCQIIDYPGIDDEQDLDQQLLQLHDTIAEFKIYAICFIAQNGDQNSIKFQKKVLKYFNNKDTNKIFLIITFSDFQQIQQADQSLLKSFNSQSISFFEESLKNPINMVYLKKTWNNIQLLEKEIEQIKEEIDTQIIKNTIILNKTLHIISEQYSFCQDILKIIDRSIKQYEGQKCHSEQNSELFKSFHYYKDEMEFAEKKIELNQNEKLVECNYCKLTCSENGENITSIYSSIVVVKGPYYCHTCDCLMNLHFLSDSNIFKYKKSVQKQYVDEGRRSQYLHYQSSAQKSDRALEILEKFFKQMIQNYLTILCEEQKEAYLKLQNNLFFEKKYAEIFSQFKYIKLEKIQTQTNRDLQIFIDDQIEQIDIYRCEQEQFKTRELEKKFNHQIHLGRFKEIIQKIENYI